MKINWNYIKGIVLIVVIAILYAFADNRNTNRKILNPDIQFSDGENLFITRTMVNKLLIQNNDSIKNIAKDALDLKDLESALNKNKMIQHAEVYLTINGQLGAKIKQRTPIARIKKNADYYLDIEGRTMPLSKVFSARVPLVTGEIDKKQLKNIYAVAKYVYKDIFLKEHVVTIHQDKNNNIELKLRKNNFVVFLGDSSKIEKKINNLKAFYQKGLKDNILQHYKKIDLKFDNQVVCTKK